MKFIKNLAINLCIWVIIAIIYMLLWYGVTKNWLIVAIGIVAFSITCAIIETNSTKHTYFYLVSYRYNYDEYNCENKKTISGLGSFTFESDINTINYNKYKEIIHEIRQSFKNTNISDDDIVILNINIFKQE